MLKIFLTIVFGMSMIILALTLDYVTGHRMPSWSFFFVGMLAFGFGNAIAKSMIDD
jgi:hypothetical protein